MQLNRPSILRVSKRWTIFKPIRIDEVVAACGIITTNEVPKDPKPIQSHMPPLQSPFRWIWNAPFYSKDYVYSFEVINYPITYEKAIIDPRWRTTMQQEYDSIMKNQTLKL